MPAGLRRASPPHRRRHHDRPQGERGQGGALPRRQRPAPDQQLRLHDLPRRTRARGPTSPTPRTSRTTRSRRRSGRRSTTGTRSITGTSRCCPDRFMESSCLKCHHQVTDVPQAEKLQAGYERIVKYGCTGCHTIGGEGSFGPDLTDERQVGPNLTAHRARRCPRTGRLKWIKNPHAFRPDTRMPRFYGVTNNNAPADQPKSDAEIHAITHYLFAKSTPPADFVDPARQERSRRRQDPVLPEGLPGLPLAQALRAVEHPGRRPRATNPDYKPDAAAMYDPCGSPSRSATTPRPTTARTSRTSRPSSSRTSRATSGSPTGSRPPRRTTPEPDAQPPALARRTPPTSPRWILSVKGEWPVTVTIPEVDSHEVKRGLDEPGQALRHARGRSTPAASRSSCRSARSTSSSQRR